MQDFEKLGVFYLGRETDAAGKNAGAPVLYDSRDLVTHGVCIGMTGSGKTGLCISLIEEAAIDGVPVIAIDPKGDLGNLLLTFPKLASEDFRPWIDEDEARRAGMTPDAFAAAQADLWKKGLADWGEDGARIERLRAAAEFGIYTPGSRAGLPLSILSSFAAPATAIREDGEAMAERASVTATSVLTLAGANADPRGRELTFLSTLLMNVWRDGKDLDLPALIQLIQSPPFQKVGVIDLESFYPAKERFALAMQINTLMAAPGFEQWLQGEPLDATSLLYGAAGKPRVSVVSIAHLGDAERMFVVTLLLNQVVAWMRAQSGTTSLRAIIYMDEIAGYFPPVANPPSKAPLLTLMKQARAFGVGVLLGTQNTVDLDYKGLANAGTWFLGRLQTERDKARVLDGLEGAASGSFDRAEADRTLSALGKRVFLLHDIHEGAPRTFQTRWSMSYLRGPLSRDQIKILMDPHRKSTEASSAAAAAAVPAAAPAPASAPPKPRAAAATSASESAPVLPPDIKQWFVPGATSGETYEPVVLGAARVGYSDTKLGINETRDVVAATGISEGAVAVDWSAAEILDVAPSALETDPSAGVAFADLPKAAANVKSYPAWQKAFAAWISSEQRLELFRHAALQLTSKAGESERDFRIRVQTAQREARDAAVEQIRQKFAARRAALEEKLRKAEQSVTREQKEKSNQLLQTGISIVAAVGEFLRQKKVTGSNIGRTTTAVRGLERSAKQAQDVGFAQENVEAVNKALADLDSQVAAEKSAIADRFDALADKLEKVSIAPKRGQVNVQFVALGWRAK